MVNMITALCGYFSGTFVSDTGGTFKSDTPGTFVSDIGGTFEVILSIYQIIGKMLAYLKIFHEYCMKVVHMLTLY